MKRALYVDTDEGVSEAKHVFRDMFGTGLLYARNYHAAITILSTHDIGLVLTEAAFPQSPQIQDVVSKLNGVEFVNFPRAEREKVMTLITQFLGFQQTSE